MRSYITGKDVNPAIKEMEAMILECASLDREINHFVDVVQQVTAEVRATWHDLITSGKSLRLPTRCWFGMTGETLKLILIVKVHK